MAFESVNIVSTRNGSTSIVGFRQDLLAGETVGLSLSSTVGITSVLWELLGRPEFSAAGGAGPEPVVLATAPTSSFVVDSDSGSVHKDGTYLVRATINPGSPGQVRKTCAVARVSGLTIPGPSGALALRKPGGFEALEDTSNPNCRQGYATPENRWHELLRSIASGGGVIETLAGAYSVGAGAGDQTLLLNDANGGGVVVDGSNGGFTGTSALRINTAAAGPFVVDRATGNIGIGNASPVEELHVKSASPGIRLDRTGGAAISLENITDVLNLINRTGPVTIATFPGTGGMRTDFGVGIGAASPTAAALAMGAGSAVAVSGANTGRFRYNEVTQQFEVSQNGAPYAPLGAGAASVLETDGIVTGGVQLSSLAFPATGAVYAHVKSVRDLFYLDRTSALTADGITIVTALGGTGRWIRMCLVDSSWFSTTAWTINPSTANDEGATTLRTRSELARRINGMRCTAPITVSVTGSLLAGDVLEPQVVSDLTNFITWTGVPISLFSGTVTAMTNRSGVGHQPTLMTISSIASSWTPFLNMVVFRDDGGGNFVASRVALDMGSKQAWLSPPVNQSNLESTFNVNDTVTVYDVPSLGNSVYHNTAKAQYTWLKVNQRWLSHSGQLFMDRCWGDSFFFGGSVSSTNGVSGGLFSGANFQNLGARLTITGGYHRLINVGGSCNIAQTATFKAIQVENSQIFTVVGGSFGTPDIEICTTSTSLTPLLFDGFGTPSLSCQGYVYGSTARTGSLFAEMQARSGLISLGHVPNVTGANLISYTIAGITENVSVLATRESNDVNGNRVIGPAGPTWNDNRGQTILNVGSAGGVGTSAVNWNDVLGAVGGAVVSLTPGSVVFANASGHLDQDNANFFWDHTNERLGLGTNTPAVELDLLHAQNAATTARVSNTSTGTAALAQFVARNSSGSAAWGLTSTGFTPVSPDPSLGVSTAFFSGPSVYVGSTAAISLQTGATRAERLKVLTTGEVQLSSLAAGGIVKAGAGGQLAVAVAGTDYLSAAVAITAGAGLTGGGTTGAPFSIDVAATDGSIAVGANSIGVGTLQNDGQHGNLGGGGLHAIATHLAAGFMSAADKANLDGLVSGGVPGSRLLTAAAGFTVGSGGDLTADRTFTIGQNADGSILVNTHDIQVGVLATDAQHGNRGGGSLHAVATTGAAGFMSATDKTQLAQAKFIVQTTTNAPASSLSLGALASGVLQHVVTGIISAPTSLAVVGGQIPFGNASGSGLLDQDANFFWDNTNKRLGLGTQIPATDIEASRSVNGTTTIRVTNANAGSAADALFSVSNGGTAAAAFGITGFSWVEAGGSTTPNRLANMSFLTTTTLGPSPAVYVGSHGFITLQTGATQAERLHISNAGAVSISALSGGGLVKSALTTGLLSNAVAGTDFLVPVSGTLTAGSVLFGGAGGAVAQDNANFFWNDVNNRLGIGTSTPIADLDVLDSANGSTQVMVRNQGGGAAALAQFVATNNAGGGIGVAVGVAGTGFSATTNRPLVIAGTPYVVPHFGSSSLYIGAPSTLILATGATEANRLQILSSGFINVSSLSTGGLVVSAASTGQLSNQTMTASQVAFGAASGGTLAQDPGLIWDNTNKRLGAGASISAPSFDLHVAHTTNADTVIMVENDSAGTTASAEYVASNGSGLAHFGVTGSGYSAIVSLPNLGPSTTYLRTNGGNPLYIGAVTDITLQTGNPQAEVMRLLSTGEVVIKNKLAGSTSAGGKLILEGTTHATLHGSVTCNDPFGIGRDPGTIGSAPMFAIAGNVAVNSSAGAVCDYVVINTPTVNISGGTNIVNAGGFNFITIQPPIYSGSIAIGAGGFAPPAATLCIEGAPSVTGGASFNNGASLGPLGLWVKASAQVDGSLNLNNDLNMNGTINVSTNGVFLGNLTANGLLSGGSSQAINARVISSFLVGTMPTWAINATVDVGPSNPKLGFFSTSPIAKPTVSGSHSANAALTSLVAALSNLGLITDATS